MAFVVETGAGFANSNGYISVAFFRSYHADRGHDSAASLIDADVQTCIVRASDYIDKRFSQKMRGCKTSRQNSMAYPRQEVLDNQGKYICMSDELPNELLRATAEYALRAAVYSELAPDPLMSVPLQDFTGDDLPEPADAPGPQAIREKTEKVDVVEESVAYQSLTQQRNTTSGRASTSALVTSGNIPEYPAADMLLEPLLRFGNRTLARGS